MVRSLPETVTWRHVHEQVGKPRRAFGYITRHFQTMVSSFQAAGSACWSLLFVLLHQVEIRLQI